jgi:hypothetical protein
MAETDDPWQIERTTPAIEVDLRTRGGEDVVLNYNNTTLYHFCGAWAFIDHVWRVNDQGVMGIYIFDSPNLMQQLDEYNFPSRRMPYPNDSDLLAYRNYLRGHLDDELDGL